MYRPAIFPALLVLILGPQHGLAGETRSPEAGPSAGYRIIVNAANPATDVTRGEVAALFLRGLARWRHGASSAPVDQSLGSPVREAFSRDLLGMTPGGVRRHWEERMVSARETPPPARASDEEVVTHVEKKAGGIGYVTAAAALPPTVKAIRIVE